MVKRADFLDGNYPLRCYMDGRAENSNKIMSINSARTGENIECSHDNAIRAFAYVIGVS
jgi:hypothetical protein